MRLLLIEDEVSLHEVISNRLRAEGYIVDSCFDGSEGYDYAMGIAYDCIILDIMLPKLNGLALLKKLR
jgi:DNA-binding response OmpR family regulator